MKLPSGVFEHWASVSSQLCVIMAHSSMSNNNESERNSKKFGRNTFYSPKHVPAVPFPVYPASHVHVKLPAGVFEHVASVSSQLCIFIAHSSISKQQGK